MPNFYRFRENGLDYSFDDVFVPADLFRDGNLWVWGNGNQGRLGNTTTTTINSTPITTFTGGANWKQVSTGLNFTASIKSDGTLWTWGEGGDGRLGSNGSSDVSTPITTFAGGTNWKQVSCGRDFSGAIKTDGTLWTWGYAYDIATARIDSFRVPVTTFSGGTNWSDTITEPEDLYTLSGGDGHTAAIKTDGTLWIWAIGTNGRLGNANTANISTPVTTFAGGTNWRQVDLGIAHSVAIKTDGTIWGWGTGGSGQLGNASIATINSTPVTTFAGGTNWKQVSSKFNHTAAIKTDGTLWTWGSGIHGRLGNANTIDRSTPVTTFTGGTNWKQVSSGGRHTAAIKTDGTLWVWGNGQYGRLGNAVTTDASTPITTFAGGTNWKQVSAGYTFLSAIKTDGTLWVWGIGNNGVLGNANTTDVSTPVTTFSGGTNWKQVSAGTFHMAAIKTDGTLWTWGLGSSQQLGNTLSSNRSTPVTTFAGGTNWRQVVTGGQHTVALRDDGINSELFVWGLGTAGRLGNANTTNRSTPITTFAGGTNWADVEQILYTLSSGTNNSAALKADGTLWTWGGNIDGELGNASTTNVSTPLTTFAGGTNWKQISCGGYHTAAIKTDGTLWTWGRASNGELGNATIVTDRSTPVTTFAGGTNWKQVSSGFSFTSATKTDGTLWVWGSGGNGRLGNGVTTGNISTPVTTFAGGTNWKQAGSSTGSHMMGIKTDGTLWTWGNNSYGQLGNANTTNVSTPITTFIGGTNWKQTSAGISFTAATKTDGTLWLWGRNGTTGRLGTASIATNSSTPVTTFAGGTNWKQVSCGDAHTAAIKTDGTLWTWGYSDNGQLGNNQYTSRSTPVTTFAGGTNWKQVHGGDGHTIALSGNELFLFGSSGYGQIGNAQVTTSRSIPLEPVPSATNWKSISCGYRHSAAIKTDGTLWVWGNGSSGQLGNADTTRTTTPVTTFIGGTNWKQVSSGQDFTAAIKTDGTLWTWGNTSYGRLGNAITQISIATDSGVSGICNTTTRLTGTSTFVPSPNTGTRITTSSGDTGTVTSIANSLLGAASLTADTTVTSGTNDDGYWTLTLPFNISYNGTSYGTIYVGTNSYVTFNSGFTVFDTLSTSNPNDQKIMISSGDRSGQRIYFGTEGTAPNRTYRVRFEGSTGTSGVLGSPTMLWEMVFYENATSQIDIQVGINNGVTVTSSTSNSTPVTTFAGGTNWKQVSCGQFHVGAIKTDGTLWTWGEGVSSKLGNANITNRSTPVTTFSGGTNWKQVSATRSNTLAIKTDGTLWTWGEGDDGRLGNANTSDRSTPVTTFAGGTNWKEVGLGPSRHGAAIIYDDPVL